MFTLLRTLSLGYIHQRWTRTCLLVVSIALGVATLVATRALHDALRKSALAGIGPFTKKNDLVVSNGQTGLPLSVLARLREPAIPGVTAIVPFVRGRAFLPDLENTPAWVIGLDLLDAGTAGAGATAQP